MGGKDVHFLGRAWDCNCQIPIAELQSLFKAANPWGDYLEKSIGKGLSIYRGSGDIFYTVDLIYISRTLSMENRDYTFFFNTHETLTKMTIYLGHKKPQ